MGMLFLHITGLVLLLFCAFVLVLFLGFLVGQTAVIAKYTKVLSFRYLGFILVVSAITTVMYVLLHAFYATAEYYTAYVVVLSAILLFVFIKSFMFSSKPAHLAGDKNTELVCVQNSKLRFHYRISQKNRDKIKALLQVFNITITPRRGSSITVNYHIGNKNPVMNRRDYKWFVRRYMGLVVLRDQTRFDYVLLVVVYDKKTQTASLKHIYHQPEITQGH